MRKRGILGDVDWEMVFKNLSLPVAILDADQNIVFLNELQKKLLAGDARDLRGIKCWEIFHGPDIKGPPPGCPFLQIAAANKATNNEIIVEALQGTYIISCVPIFDKNGRLNKVLHLATDVTERKRLDEKTFALLDTVKQEKNRLSSLVDSISDEVWFLDNQGRVAVANPSARREFLLDNREHVDVRELLRALEILRPDGTPRPLDEAPPLRALAGEVIREEEEITRTPATGELRYRQVSSTPVKDGTGAIVGSVTIVRDTTEQKRADMERALLEAQLKQAQKLDAVGRLAGGIAHEFNNLLTGITGNVSLAMMELPSDDPMRQALEDADAAAGRAAKLVKELLAFARRQIIEPKVTDMNKLLLGLEGMIRYQLGENIQFTMKLGDISGKIMADPRQIEQVVANLVTNAREAMPDGGRLAIETSEAELDEAYCRRHPETRPGLYVALSISDTGRGIDAATKLKLFDPFFTTKEVGKGTGLGLPTSYGIVKQHLGSIEVYSEVGRGSTFKIYLPRVEHEVEKTVQDRDIRSLPTGSETILLVEDEEIVRNYAFKLLRHQGYNVLQAENGDEALKLAEKVAGPIHLLLTDVIMPGMSGIVLAKRLRSARPGVRVLYSSGYTEEMVTRKGDSEAAGEFIGKPYSTQALAVKVREVLDDK